MENNGGDLTTIATGYLNEAVVFSKSNILASFRSFCCSQPIISGKKLLLRQVLDPHVCTQI